MNAKPTNKSQLFIVWKQWWWIEAKAWISYQHIDSLVQDCSISNALTMEILQSCIKQSISINHNSSLHKHDDVIKWKHFLRYWPFVRGIHRFPVNSPHKGQWRGALMFALIYVWINGWVNNREAGDLRRHRAHFDVIVMNCQHDHIITWHTLRYYWPYLRESTGYQWITLKNGY